MSILSSKNKILRTVHKDSITTLTSRLDFFLSWIWKTLQDNIISFFETEEMEAWTAKDLVRYQFILDLDQTLCVSVHCPSHFFQLTEKCVLSITVNRCINDAFKIMFCLFSPLRYEYPCPQSVFYVLCKPAEHIFIESSDIHVILKCILQTFPFI